MQPNRQMHATLAGVAVLVAIIVFLVYWYNLGWVNLGMNEDDVNIRQMFRTHPLYMMFKERYPDASESFSTRDIHALFLEKADAHGNTLLLRMLFDRESYHYSYALMCGTDRPMKPAGGMYLHAFDFWHDNDCLQDQV